MRKAWIVISMWIALSSYSDQRINYVSSTDDGYGNYMVQFDGFQRAAYVNGQPHIGWVEGFGESDCWFNWCGELYFIQDGVTYSGSYTN